jgi:hypothetical protein
LSARGARGEKVNLNTKKDVYRNGGNHTIRIILHRPSSLLIDHGAEANSRIMRQIWNAQGKRAFIEEKLPYYKDPIVYLPVLVISLVI